MFILGVLVGMVFVGIAMAIKGAWTKPYIRTSSSSGSRSQWETAGRIIKTLNEPEKAKKNHH